MMARMRPSTTTIQTDWPSPTAVSRELGCGVRTIYRAIARGELKAARINGRGDLRISRQWLRDWLAALSERREVTVRG